VLAGLAAAVGGLVLAVVLAAGGGAEITIDGGDSGPFGSADPAPGSDVAAGGQVVVDVVGAVLRPGVYRLATGSRVGDAIAAAGGYGPRVAADRVDRELNLAEVIRDGQQITVPSRDDPAAVGGGSSPGSGGAGAGLIDLNSATESELDTLPGIGPVTAAKILAARFELPFRSVDELVSRKLVGQSTFDGLKDLVTVN
jgi:competence protein ComEA